MLIRFKSSAYLLANALFTTYIAVIQYLWDGIKA